MLKSLLLLLLSGSAASALAQQVPARPTSFPVGHRPTHAQYSPGGLARPFGPVGAAAQLPAPIPTLRAAAAYAPPPPVAGPPASTELPRRCRRPRATT